MDVKNLVGGNLYGILLAFSILSLSAQNCLGQFSGGTFQPNSGVNNARSTLLQSSAQSPTGFQQQSQFGGDSRFQARTQNDTSFAGSQTAKINWIDGRNINSAFQLAARENKPVMLHFWNERCGPCMALEQYVFPNPLLAQAINSQFVCVKVNTMQTPEIHKKYGVTRWPWDVFVSANGMKLSERASIQNASQYTQYVNSVAKIHQNFMNLAANDANSAVTQATNTTVETRGANSFASANSNTGFTTSTAPPTNSNVQSNSFAPSGPNATANSGSSIEFQNHQGPARVQNRFFANQENKDQARGDTPPVGLEGYCPVSMLRETRKVTGSKDWGCIHRGRLYFFANQAYRDIFMKDPDRYAPVLAGYDVVIFRDSGKLVEGKTEFGGFVGQNENRVVFLFANEENKKKFIADKQQRYVQAAKVATKNSRENWLR